MRKSNLQLPALITSHFQGAACGGDRGGLSAAAELLPVRLLLEAVLPPQLLLLRAGLPLLGWRTSRCTRAGTTCTAT